jgi:uncharacterized Fe-S cluster-containing MiaB family protein
MNEHATAADIRFTLDGDRTVTVYHSAKDRAIVAIVAYTAANGTRRFDHHQLRRNTDFHDTVDAAQIRQDAEALQ